ncbi:4562_t:CDS:2, partial [Dentiscutata erythropus]
MNAKKHRTSNLDNEGFISENTSSDDMASSDDMTINNEESMPKSDELLEHKRKWNSIWEVTYPWLRLGQKENKQSIKWHIKTKDHQKLIQAQEEFQISLEIGFTQQLEATKNLIATSKITDLTSLTEYHIKCDIAEEYTSKETYILNHPILELLEESHTDYRSYSNAYAAREFIDAIGRVIEEAICQEI